MKKLLLCIFCFFSCSCNHSSAPKPVVVVYPSWKHTTLSLAKLPWDKFSHIAVASVYPLESGSIKSDQLDPFINDLIELAHSKGKKVILSVGGAGDGSKHFKVIASDEKKKLQFITMLLEYVAHNGFDGIDIDWEYWTYQSELGKGGNDPVESNLLLQLVSDINKAMSDDLLLTVDVSAGSWVGPQYLTELQNHVDFVNLMAFDFTGAWPESRVAHHSDFRTFKKALQYIISKGFVKEKILVGLPAYGIEFINGKKDQIKHVAYSDIVEKVGGDHRALAKGKLGTLFFENSEYISKKCLHVAKMGVGGVFLFDVLSDDENDGLSLLSACNKFIPPLTISTNDNKKVSSP